MDEKIDKKMTKNEQKKWVQDALKKKLDIEDAIELLKAQGYEEKERDKVLKILEIEKEEVDKMEIGFFQKRKLKKLLKKVREKKEETEKVMKELNSNLKKLSKKEDKKLKDMKKQMIIAIVGNPLKDIIGLNTVFEIVDDETGEDITKEELELSTIEEIDELLTDLLDKLDKEI
jgi:hypothetical protein